MTFDPKEARRVAEEHLAKRETATAWFCFDGEDYNTYPTADDAEKAAAIALDDYQSEAGDGWAEEVTQIAWGEIVQHAAVVKERPVDSEVDYVSSDIEMIWEIELVGDAPDHSDIDRLLIAACQRVEELDEIVDQRNVMCSREFQRAEALDAKVTKMQKAAEWHRDRIHALETDLRLRDCDLEEAREALSAFEGYDGDEDLWATMKQERDALKQRVEELTRVRDCLEKQCNGARQEIDASVGRLTAENATLKQRARELAAKLEGTKGFLRYHDDPYYATLNREAHE